MAPSVTLSQDGAKPALAFGQSDVARLNSTFRIFG